MKTGELIDVIRENKECNFIGCCGSLLQINGVNATIMYLKSKGVKLNGFVIIKASDTLRKEDYCNKYFVKDPGISYIDGSILFMDLNAWERLSYILNSLRFLINSRVNKEIYIVEDLFFFHWAKVVNDSLGDRRIIYCEIDDGIGNYRVRNKDLIVRGTNGSTIIKRCSFIVKHFIRKPLTSWILPTLKRTRCYIDCKSMVIGKSGLKKNDDVVEYWKDSFRKNISNYDYSIIEKVEDNILILGTNDEGIEEDENNCISIVVSLAKEKKRKVIIKPHPRDKRLDRYRDLGCEILEDKYIAAEEIFSVLKKKPFCIAGYGSTVLVTGKVLFDVPAISFSSVIKGTDRYTRYVNESFEKRFGDTVTCPRTYNDLYLYVVKLERNVTNANHDK